MRSRRPLQRLLIPVALLTANDARPQQPFDLDTTFRTVVDQVYVSSILPLPDGGAVASGLMRFQGELDDKRLVRLLPNGQRDASFYNSGLGGGFLKPWANHFYVSTPHTVRRILPDGTQDPSFIGMNLGPYFSSLQGGDYHVYTDGRILMSGVHVLSDSIRGFEGLYCLIWFSNTGYLDTTKTHRTCAGSLDFFQELPNGQFIGSGSTSTWDGQPASNIVRFEADGELDPTFQANVWWGQAYGFLPLADGRVYAVGKFRITGISDTLNLVRFMPDGSLDPTFNNHLDFRITEMTNLNEGPILRGIRPLDEGQLVVTGQFELIEGEARRNICLIDTSGNLLNDYFSGPGCGNFVYQNDTVSSIGGIIPAPDGSYYIWGAYHGYDDGTTNDTLQRMVSRLYGLNVGVDEQLEVEGRMLEVWPNPAQDQLHVQFPEGVEGGLLRVLDATGRVVREERFAAQVSTFNFPVSDLPAGLYALELMDQHAGRWLAKWVKE